MEVSSRSGSALLPPAVLAAWLSTRAGLLVLAWAGLRLFPGARLDREWRAFPDHLWIDGWAH